MKKIKTILLLYVLLLLGCSSGETIPENEEWIKVSCNPISLFPGQQYMVDVEFEENSDVVLREKDSEIASGWWVNNGKSIRVVSESIGSTVIYITDKNKYDRIYELNILSDYFYGNYKEGNGMDIVVQTRDEAITPIITDELKTMAEARVGIIYSFDKTNKKVEIDYSQTKMGGEKKVGTYEWGTEYLTLHLEGTSQEYGFASRWVDEIDIIIDLKTMYQSKYPDIQINFAKIIIPLEKI